MKNSNKSLIISGVKNARNRDVFPIIADRLTQKQLFDKLHLPTAPWQLLAERSEWPAVFDFCCCLYQRTRWRGL